MATVSLKHRIHYYIICLAYFSAVYSVPLFCLFLIYNWTTRIFALCYIFYMYWDRETPETGGGVTLKRLFPYYKAASQDYHKIQYKYLAQYDKNRNYICGLHPHGIRAAATAVIFEGMLKYNLVVASSGFWVPILREYYLTINAISATKKSLQYVLDYPGGGRVVGLVVGGQREQLYAHPGNHKLVLKSRKGFCRLALVTGASIIPSYCFGELELCDTFIFDENHPVSKMQLWILKHFRISVFLLKHPIPKPAPITVVTGPAIYVEKVKKPTNEQVDALHQRYVNELTKLFDDNKAECGEPNAVLRIV